MDGYDVLGLAPGASERQVRMAYRRLARLHHPDKQHRGGRDAAQRRMQLVNLAREQVLQDVRARAAPRSAPASPQHVRAPLLDERVAAARMSDAALRRQRLAREEQLRRQRLERLRWAAQASGSARVVAPDPARVVATTWARRLVVVVLTPLVLVVTLVFSTSLGLWLANAAASVVELVSDGHTWSVVAQPAAVAGVVLMSLVASLRAGWECARTLWR